MVAVPIRESGTNREWPLGVARHEKSPPRQAPELGVRAASRLLDVDYGASLMLENLTLTGGGGAYGGAILNHGALTLSGVTLSWDGVAFAGGGILVKRVADLGKRHDRGPGWRLRRRGVRCRRHGDPVQRRHTIQYD